MFKGFHKVKWLKTIYKKKIFLCEMVCTLSCLHTESLNIMTSAEWHSCQGKDSSQFSWSIRQHIPHSDRNCVKNIQIILYFMALPIVHYNLYITRLFSFYSVSILHLDIKINFYFCKLYYLFFDSSADSTKYWAQQCH